MQEEAYKYWAFISYSHRDQAWAEWLHRALEAYRVPRRLVGRPSIGGVIPRRLFPVFRDQEELPSSPSLSAAIDQALRQSRYLIVIASPYAAVSKWVDQEIARFRALGRGDRILCLIVDGEPHAHLQPGKGLLECFPPELRIDGFEPIGADLRQGRDGKPASKLKLIAGILGVGLDELRRRELRRRRLQRLGLATLLLLSVGALSGLWMMQQREKHEALAQQTLRTHLDTVYEKGRQELLARNQARAAVYLNEAYRLGIDTPALRFMLAQAMRIVETEKATFQTGDPVQMVRLSPDARQLLSKGTNSIVRVWEAASGHKRFEFALPAGDMIVGPRFSRDSRLLYLIDVPDHAPAGLIKVWDAASGQLLRSVPIAPSGSRTFNPFSEQDRVIAYLAPNGAAQISDLGSGRLRRRLRGPYSAAGFSRDGLRLFAGRPSGEVEIWDAAATRLIHVLQGLHAQIDEIDDTEDGSVIAASARDGSIRAWQEKDGALRIIGGHPSPRPWLIFNLDGTRLFTGGDDGARVWDTANGALVYAIQSGATSTRFDISSSGRWILQSSTSRLAMQDLESGAELFTLDGNRGLARARDISEDDREIVTAGADGRVVLWNTPRIPDAEFRHRMDPEHLDKIPTWPAAAVYSHSGKQIYTGAADGRIKAWVVDSKAPAYVIEADSSSVTALEVSSDDQRLLSGGSAEGIKLWGAADGHLLRRFDCGGKEVLQATLSRDGRYIAGVLRGGDTRIWDAVTGEVTVTFPPGQVSTVHFSTDGTRLALAGKGGVSLWLAAQRRIVWTWLPPQPAGTPVVEFGAIDFSADSRRILVASTGATAYVLDADDHGRVLGQLQEPSASNLLSARFDSSGEQAVFGDASGIALLWRPRDSRTLILRGHSAEVRTAEFSGDGAFVLTTSADGTGRIWDAATGQLLDIIAVHGNPMPKPPFHAAAFSPQEDSVLTGSRDGTFRLWQMRRESRSAEAVAAILHCRVPWKLDGDSLLAATPDDGACALP